VIELSSDGAASLEWQEGSEQQEGITPLEIGAQVYSSAEGNSSFRNCLIAETDKPAGMLLSFPLSEKNCMSMPNLLLSIWMII
jgi:hypothetical protein